MERRFLITVDGHPYHVTVTELGDHGAPAALLHTGSGTHEAAPTPPPQAGATGVPVAASARAAGPAGASTDTPTGTPGDVLATLGGVVQSVVVTLGEPVQQGDVVVVLESMKMNTPMVAARSGRVTQLCVKPGDPVQAGQLLATIG